MFTLAPAIQMLARMPPCVIESLSKDTGLWEASKIAKVFSWSASLVFSQPAPLNVMPFLIRISPSSQIPSVKQMIGAFLGCVNCLLDGLSRLHCHCTVHLR
jgi:hypothetical protein